MRHETNFPTVSPDELAKLGQGRVAYMRQISGREIAEAFPGTVELDPNATVWALFGADGTPLAIADDAGGALSTAFQNDLTPVTVH
ncbi:MAG: DUF1150 domain-containing protein [Salaquimonas sp.]|jgi:hypothetical protein|nr:DUF1150 domain-containing protein [Salaquimonas sp.]